MAAYGFHISLQKANRTIQLTALISERLKEKSSCKVAVNKL